ncbi:SurA N-terminal domain-containing protein [Halobacillus sp. Marseille-P3879]|uniref:SurA N-terminal domain-containing protein n=1 Tax=Halobacillus sp. Marseille-P3879 TaxID=2045014 RepID=UPI00135C7656|nr:SurA N-terminal domain-containing protein [Halobacillus sp. Marseille-P3879]
MRKDLISVLLLVFTLCGLAACSQEEKAEGGTTKENQTESSSADGNEEEGPVAIVNGKELSREDFDQQLSNAEQQYESRGIDMEGQEDQVHQSVVDEMIGMELLQQEAENEGFEASQEEIDQRYEEFTSQFESKEAQEEAFEETGLDEETVRDELESSIMINKYVDEAIEEVEVSEEEIEEQYDAMSEEQGEDAPGYDEAREQIEQQLISQKESDQVNELIDSLRDEADIEVMI